VTAIYRLIWHGHGTSRVSSPPCRRWVMSRTTGISPRLTPSGSYSDLGERAARVHVDPTRLPRLSPSRRISCKSVHKYRPLTCAFRAARSATHPSRPTGHPVTASPPTGEEGKRPGSSWSTPPSDRPWLVGLSCWACLGSMATGQIVADRIVHAKKACTLAMYTHKSTGRTVARPKPRSGCYSPAGCRARSARPHTSAPRQGSD
jgi:hypothetical protein